ncbi:MAG: ABC transporter permease, partial [Acidiferrobacteraceae bacterium]
MSPGHLLPFRPVMLDTDFLLYVLLGATAVLVVRVRRNPAESARWRRVFARPGAMIAIVILAVYVAVALLDSIHFRAAIYAPDGAVSGYSPQVLSVLDVVCGPLRRHVEQTYSAPFAEHALIRKTITLAGGLEKRQFPRLVWGGRGLVGRDARLWDVLARTGRGFIEGIAVWSVLLGVAWATRRPRPAPREAWRRLWRDADLPWGAAWMAVAAVVLVTAIIANLAPEYHVLGTDQVGIDVLYKSLKSVRTGVIIGTVTTLVTLPFALVFGIAAGYFGGVVDDIVQYLYTTLSSVPGVLLIAAAVLSL